MEYRQELIAKMQKIVADAGDTMTDEQQTEFNSLKAQVDLIDAGGADAETGAMGRPSEQAYNRPKPAEQISSDKTGWIDGNGKSIKIYDKTDKMGTGEYSVGKFVKGMLTGNWSGADREHELFATTTTNNSAGGYSIPMHLHEEIIDLARANMVLNDAGMRTVQLEQGNNKILRVLTDPSVEVKAELADFTATNPTFDLVEFTPYTIGCYVQVSQELAQDGQNFAQIIQQVMTQALAAKLDYLGLYGTGTAQPTGLANVSGINTEAVATWAHDDILNGVSACQVDNCLSVNSYILSPNTNNSLNQLKDTTGQYITPPADLNKLGKHITTSMADEDCLVGDFSKLYLGMRSGVQFEMSPVADDSFQKYAMAFRVVMRADFATVRPNHFCLVSQNIS